MPRTELVWDGKYDAQGKWVAPFKLQLPYQTIETVNESASERRNLLSFLDRDKPWRNRLIWGDKKYVLPSLLPEFAGKVNIPLSVTHSYAEPGDYRVVVKVIDILGNDTTKTLTVNVK